MVLSLPEILDRLEALGIQGVLQLIMAAAVLCESEGNLQAWGDNGHSTGPYQMHDQGAGAGLSVEQRQDFEFSSSHMYKHEFLPALAQGRDEHKLEGEDLATWVYLRAERPLGYNASNVQLSLTSGAANRYRQKWRLVLTADGQLDTDSGVLTQELRAAYLQELRKHLGTPYVFGGKQPGSFDCSGLVTWCARQVGIDLGNPTMTSAQAIYEQLEEIDSTTALPGDLLFFHSTYGPFNPHYATHVGVSLGAGSLKMLDTHEPGGVQETTLGPYWQNHWMAAGRLPVPAVPAASAIEAPEVPTAPLGADAGGPSMRPVTDSLDHVTASLDRLCNAVESIRDLLQGRG